VQKYKAQINAVTWHKLLRNICPSGDVDHYTTATNPNTHAWLEMAGIDWNGLEWAGMGWNRLE
jgi:hypothetical protein